jgi:hypothetical protein
MVGSCLSESTFEASMKQSILRIVVALTTLGVGVCIITACAIYQEHAEVIAVAIPEVSPVGPNYYSDTGRYMFSADTYIWYMRKDHPAAWMPIILTGPNNPCELKDDPEYVVPDKIVRLCAEWAGQGNIFEWLRWRGERDSVDAPPNKGMQRTRK